MREIYTQGSIAEFEHDGDDLDCYYLPTRAISFGVNKGGLVVLPETQEIKVYVGQLEKVLNQIKVRAPQTILIPDSNYFLDLALLEHISLLSEKLTRGENYSVWPYARTENLDSWVEELKSSGFNISVALPHRVYFEDLKHPQHRGGWGRWVDEPGELSFAERYGLPYPVSWLGRGLNQVKEAYARVVQKTGKNGALLKPVFSAGGFTIKRVGSEEELMGHYKGLEASGALKLFGQEMPIEVQEEINDIVELGSVQYRGQEILTPGKMSLQLVEENRWVGNIFNNGLSKEVKKEVDWEAINEYLTYGYVLPPKTGFLNINKLEPGHFLIMDIKNKKLLNKYYWTPDYSKKLDLSEEEWTKSILSKLRESVKLRMMHLINPVK